MGLLDNLLGIGRSRNESGTPPLTMALLCLLAYRVFHGKGRLAETLGRSELGRSELGRSELGRSKLVRSEPDVNTNGAGTGAAPPGGWLGGLLGEGEAGSILSGGLGDLVKEFQQNGQGDKAISWIARGANRPISPSELEQALGEEKIGWLTQETGISRDELLSGLSRALPETVDRLTPDGRLPTEREAARLV